MRFVSLILLPLAMLAGCVVAPPPVRPPVPVVRVEPIPPPPTAQVVWQPGEWHWNGAGYVWRPGRYVERRVEYHRYVQGHWDPRGDWIPGRWV